MYDHRERIMLRRQTIVIDDPRICLIIVIGYYAKTSAMNTLKPNTKLLKRLQRHMK